MLEHWTPLLAFGWRRPLLQRWLEWRLTKRLGGVGLHVLESPGSHPQQRENGLGRLAEMELVPGVLGTGLEKLAPARPDPPGPPELLCCEREPALLVRRAFVMPLLHPCRAMSGRNGPLRAFASTSKTDRT